MFAEFFKESDRVHAFQAVSMPQRGGGHPHGAVVSDTEDSNSDGKDSVMPQLIYLDKSDDEEYNPRESLSDPLTTEPIPKPEPTSGKPTKEPTLEPDSDALSEPFKPMMKGSMGRLAPKYIVRYQKRSDQPRFSTLEERMKKATWGDT